jgi:triosephosphate isomerase
MKKLVVGNWKMYGNSAMAKALAASVARKSGDFPEAGVVLCPPHVLLAQVGQWLAGAKAALGAQDCHSETEGAFTGDVSASMLKEAGCSYVIVGHSERRSAYCETDEMVRKKAKKAIKSGLCPIICVGETLEERVQGKAEEVVGRQVRGSIPDAAKATGDQKSNFVLAYEPVWAIGSGKIPTMDDIAQMHTYIVSVASKCVGCAPEVVAVLYGGSVKAANARDIMSVRGVAGVLVGGASLKEDEFCSIIAAVK